MHNFVFILAACVGAVSTPLFAQSLYTAAPSPDTATPLSYPASTPNNGQPISSVRAITGFGTAYSFGSSSSNSRLLPTLPYATEYYSNGHAIYTEILSPLIGAKFVPGNTFPVSTGLAAGGSTTTSLLYGNPVGCTINVNCLYNPQIAQFQAAYGTFAANDVVIHWGAVNDFGTTVINSLAVEQSVQATAIAQETLAIQQLVGLGARNLVFVGLVDIGTFAAYNAVSPNASALLTAGALGTNAGVIPNLIGIHNQTGANIHYFDLNLMINEIRANPATYGYSVAGVQPNSSCVTLFPFNTNTACGKASFAVQNQTLSLDGIHWTYRFHDILGQAIANQLVAPFTMAPEGEIAVQGGAAFASNLLRRLDAQRLRDGGTETNFDAPTTTASVHRFAEQPISLFAEGGFVGGSRGSQPGGAGFNYGFANLTVGAEVKATPDLLIGFAFDYSQPIVSLKGLEPIGVTRLDDNSYHFGGYASFNRSNYYANIILGYGLDTFNTSRTGVIDRLQSNPNSNGFIAAGRSAYLFDLGRLKAGPLGSFVYNRVVIDAYSESGDPLLTQNVGRQDLSSLTGGAGMQATMTFLAGNRMVSPFLNLTAEHDFVGTRHLLTTAQTYLTTLPINTKVGYAPDRAYGLAEAGLNIDFGPRLTLGVTGSASFARALGDNYGANGSIRYRF